MKQKLFNVLMSKLKDLETRSDAVNDECIFLEKKLQKIEAEGYADVTEYNAIIARVEELKTESKAINKEFEQIFAL